MKRKIFAALVAVVMVVSMLPMSVMAAETVEVATIDALVDAIEAGETSIKITDDLIITEDVTIEATAEDVVIDATEVDDVFTVNTGTLTLGNGITVNSDTSIIWVNGGKVVVDGATLNATSVYMPYNAVSVWKGSLEVKAGSIEQSNSTNATITVKGADSTVAISGGKVTSAHASALRVADSAVATISGGEVVTTCEDPAYCAAFAMGSGKIVMTGGEVSAAAGYGLVANKWDRTTGGIVEMSGGTVKKGGIKSWEDATSTFTVNGGTVMGPITVADDATMVIKAGMFSVDPTKYVVEQNVYAFGPYFLVSKVDPNKPVEPKFDTPIFPNLRSIVIDTTEGGKTGVKSGRAFGALGSTYRLTLTPDEGYEIGEVLVNGKAVEVNKNNKISFVVKGNTYVEVEFVEIED